MILDTTYQDGIKAEIEPIRFCIADSEDSSAICCSIDYDNMKDFVRINTQLCSSEGNVLYRTPLTLVGEEYTNWSGTNEEAVELVAAKLGVVLKEEEISEEE